jgi:RNA polymerase sigma factor (TIGR02999 family)
MDNLTLIPNHTESGDHQAAGDLFALVYAELRDIARAKMSAESNVLTLQPTALVHEAWLRLGGDRQPTWQSRRHFFGAAGEAMRQILIERARRRKALRHGGGQMRVDGDIIESLPNRDDDDQIVALSEALDRLAAIDPEKAELVKLRYFVGLTIEEAAAALDIGEATAKRWWTFARAWLAREIRR